MYLPDCGYIKNKTLSALLGTKLHAAFFKITRHDISTSNDKNLRSILYNCFA